MEKKYVTPEEGAELKRLHDEYRAATERAAATIVASGMSSEAFMKAEAEVSKIVGRIKEILGTTGQSWMA